MNKLAIIGMGDMGSKYAKMIFEDKSLGYEIVAITRVKGKNLERVKDYIDSVKIYESDEALFKGFDNNEFKCDTLLIVTPHMAHKYAVLEGFKRKLDILCDKPAGVSIKAGREMLEAKGDCKYGFIFHQRTYPIYVALNDVIKSNKYGKVKRISYIVTDWFRTNGYYKTSAWRATYKTDGGGTLINQCPHSLDIMCYIFGMPKEVMAFCNEGKYHPIEVEDDVTAYLRWDNGVTGVFVASTGETPGINRMEITTEKALITVYKDKIEVAVNEESADYYLNQPHEGFKQPQPKVIVKLFDKNDAYKELIRRFNEGNLVADGSDSLMSLYLANAMYLSSWKKKLVNICDVGSKEELEFEEEFEVEFNKH